MDYWTVTALVIGVVQPRNAKVKLELCYVDAT